MEVIRSISSLAKPLARSLVTLGNFDGVHRGHQHLIQQAASHRRQGEPLVVMTFDPHPVQVLYPERELARLSDLTDLQSLLVPLGVDYLVIEPFDKVLASKQPKDFLAEYIFKPLQPSWLVVGYDFAFGKDRAGHFDLIQKLCAERGIQSERVTPLQIDHEVVSSRGIRECLRLGDVNKARRWLGRNFSCNGVVVHGAGRGLELGFATLNVEPTINTLPLRGVYATHATVQGQTFASVTNVGTAPTFAGDGRVRVECHVLDAQLNAYGEKVKIEFVERLRDEIKFSSVEQLKQQIAADIQETRRILRSPR